MTLVAHCSLAHGQTPGIITPSACFATAATPPPGSAAISLNGKFTSALSSQIGVPVSAAYTWSYSDLSYSAFCANNTVDQRSGTYCYSCDGCCIWALSIGLYGVGNNCGVRRRWPPPPTRKVTFATSLPYIPFTELSPLPPMYQSSAIMCGFCSPSISLTATLTYNLVPVVPGCYQLFRVASPMQQCLDFSLSATGGKWTPYASYGGATGTWYASRHPARPAARHESAADSPAVGAPLAHQVPPRHVHCRRVGRPAFAPRRHRSRCRLLCRGRHRYRPSWRLRCAAGHLLCLEGPSPGLGQRHCGWRFVLLMGSLPLRPWGRYNRVHGWPRHRAVRAPVLTPFLRHPRRGRHCLNIVFCTMSTPTCPPRLAQHHPWEGPLWEHAAPSAGEPAQTKAAVAWL